MFLQYLKEFTSKKIGLKTCIYRPHPALENIVDSIVIIAIDFSTQTIVSPIYKFVPTHARSWMFYFEDEVFAKKKDGQYYKAARCIIVGPFITPIMLDCGKKYKSMIVNFKPGGMYRLFGVPLSEMVNTELDAFLVLGKEMDDLMDRLMNSKTDELKNEIVQNYLLKKIDSFKSILPFDLAVQELIMNKGNLTMDHVASKACLSLRQFERVSKQRIGITPKLHSRMARFSAAYKYKEQFPKTPWIKIAHEFGYYDQMHLIRDFKFFAHSNPSELKASDITGSVRFRRLEEPLL